MKSLVDITIEHDHILFQQTKYYITSSFKQTINNIEHLVLVIEEESYFYFVNNLLHREDDLPAIIWGDGSKIWAVNGQIHRNKPLPSIIWSFEKNEYYWKNTPKTKEYVEQIFLKKILKNF